MIYGIIIIITTITLTVLSVKAFKIEADRKKYMIANLSLALLGIILLSVSYFIGLTQIKTYEYDQELYSWLMDYYSLYYDLSIPPFAILLLINIIASAAWVLDKKPQHSAFKVIRDVSSILSSLLLMIFPYYGLFTQNALVPMYIYMMISGVGMALIIRISNVISLIQRNNHY